MPRHDERALSTPPKAKKSLGQNFLIDRNISRKIVELLGITTADRVVEIGPGPGALTEDLIAARPQMLELIEKDGYWAGVRQEALNKSGIFGVVRNEDALGVDWSTYRETCKCISNLPYNVASPLMWNIFSQMTGLIKAVFMVQREVGERLIAQPGSGTYGALSVWVQSHARPHQEFIVPPQVFRPAPKVHSMVLSFNPLPAAERPSHPDALSRIVHGVFQMRRKQLGVIFKHHGWCADMLAKARIDPRKRPEELSIQDFSALAGCFARVELSA